MVGSGRGMVWAMGLGLAVLLGCGGSSSSGGTGSMAVRLVDAPIAGYQEVNVHVRTVEIRGDGGWITLGAPDKTINLLDLVGGVSETLAAGSTLPAGQYGQMRLVLGPGNTVKLADGTTEPLKVPSGLQSGLKLVVNFTVEAGTTKDVWIDFDAAHSIQVVQAGASNQYILRPTLWAYDKVATGAIQGTLTDAATSTSLAGAVVYAQTVDASGNAMIARGTVTDAAGGYTLDLLPVGATYHVVSQPLTGGAVPLAYDAKASGAIALTATAPTFTYNAAFTASPLTGGISGSLVPMANDAQSDRVHLLQTLTTPSGSFAFIVRTTMATVGASAETYGFATVPVGSYRVQALRSTLGADGTTTVAASVDQPAVVSAGATATVDLGF